ncbi:DUF5676 family membrane protein [Alteromonas abrolhosensis]|uniref:DUF5676 family membrane protein n=1 Tax=Alteromonas abrolhosensis TaxID=1892904 RepID=UPI000D52A2F8|nr:DUF5676 family membrane protein [Alteromonas abrolhosensis]
MKIRENVFAFACAASFSFVWVVSSLFITTMPDMMSPKAGNIMFTDWQGMRWNVPLLGVVIGGALWALFAGVLGWLIASIYNRQL